jgi:hypothetical protein
MTQPEQWNVTYKCKVTPVQDTKAYRGSTDTAPVILTKALVGDEWSTSRCGRFTPGESNRRIHWMLG